MPAGEQQMSVLTFGSNKRITQTCEVVRVSLKTKDGPDMEMKLFSVPLICEPLVAQPISFCKEKYDHLAKLELPDDSDGTSAMVIDMLIGSDYYWELATGRMSRVAQLQFIPDWDGSYLDQYLLQDRNSRLLASSRHTHLKWMLIS